MIKGPLYFSIVELAKGFGERCTGIGTAHAKLFDDSANRHECRMFVGRSQFTGEFKTNPVLQARFMELVRAPSNGFSL